MRSLFDDSFLAGLQSTEDGAAAAPRTTHPTCRCGPVELPELPAYAMTSPAFTGPERILVLLRWQYQVSVPSAMVTIAMLP
ncbi:hypothetical protein SMICM304S_07060 [Streptomyces microflavus]